jgi:hypothetical protein
MKCRPDDYPPYESDALAMNKKKRKNRVTKFPLVTFGTIRVDFDARTVNIFGRTHGPFMNELHVLDIPVLSGDAIFLSRGDNMDRVS